MRKIVAGVFVSVDGVVEAPETCTQAMMRHAAAAVAAALPGSELMMRRGLGHTKKLNTKVIAAALTGFLTSSADHPIPGDRDTAPPQANGDHHD